TPPLIFAFVALVDRPVALVFLVAACVTLVAPAAWHRLDSRRSRARQKAYGAFAADLLDAIQGLATLKAFGQSTAPPGPREPGARRAARAGGAGAVRAHDGRARHHPPLPRPHRHRDGGRRRRGPGARRLPGPGRGHDAPGPARRPDARDRGVPAAPRAAGAPPPGHARPRLRR